ncbi:deformed epidermal autoregulatory factor 1 homolog [Rhopilema esculentum]|uniref:deformed epidermal autoregulatory factor 1 homolog n=1 Tax=Rhopilema esculentum TaxID=499914 RepID=UPI0031DA7FF6
MSARLDGTLSVDLTSLADNDASDGDELHGKNSEFDHDKSVQDEDDQVFSRNNNLVFKPNDSNGLLGEAQLLSAQNYDASKAIRASLTSGNSNLQTPNRPNDGIQNGGGLEKSSSPANASSTSSSGTPRRPSYTSKAPSALNTLPGITISEYSPVRSNFDDAHNQSLNQLNNQASSRKHSLPSLHHAQSSKEPCMLPSQSSFDESLDGYSNPGTPSSVKTDSPAPSPSGAQPGHKRAHDIRERNRVSFKVKWDEAAKSDIILVRCRDTNAELHKSRLGSGSKGKCIKVDDQWFTPTEFEQFSGRGACKDWKRSIRYAGQTLHRLIDDGIIAPHAVSCTCGICCGEEMVSSRNPSIQKGGPVKLFVPYTKAKRKRRDGEGSVSKRLSTSGEEALKDLRRARSFSMDSEVFPSLVHSGTLAAHDLDDGNMPPMTPVTPMTPITPITPFMQMTPSTPNAIRSGSPPKASVSSLALPSMTMPNTGTGNLMSLRPPATPTRTQASVLDSTLNNPHWIQLEETVTSLLSMAHQLKFMIEQAKIQSDAAKDTAVTQAKIQAENEKREAINQIRLQSIAQLSQALASAHNDKGDLQQLNMRQQITIIKNCQNCDRDALLECTGCHRVYYCSQFCQKKDWINHQRICGEQQMSVDQHNKMDGKAD